MHICIIGTGASGWLTAHALSRLSNVKKITIVGSDKIPSIGVGESNTLLFVKYLEDVFGFDVARPCKTMMKFLIDIDAAMKFGVYYEGWSDKPFLHEFMYQSGERLQDMKLLGKKPKEEWVNDYLSPMTKYVMKNHIYLEKYSTVLHIHPLRVSFHFDANMFINAMKNLAKNNTKIEHITGTAMDLLYENDSATELVLDDGRKIQADYFVSCIGQTAFNQKVFKEEYTWYGDVLLTNRAIAGPMEYTDKRNQFVPYTTARTMKHGWRWITPTWSRVGTGYVYSNNHVSDDEAAHEFLQNVGDRDFKIDPFIVDFTPRKAKNPFKKNTCTIGMAAGFVEPLDAPGLSLTIAAITHLKKILSNTQTIEAANESLDWNFKLWVAFILNQYKLSTRNDSKFWEDVKNVHFPLYDEIFAWVTGKTDKTPEGVPGGISNHSIWEPNMFYNTTAGRDITWDVTDPRPLEKVVDTVGIDGGHHLDYFTSIRQFFT
jgi:tryptophan halogenase